MWQKLQELFWPIMLLVIIVALMVVSLLLKKWLWARRYGFRKGDEIIIRSTYDFDGEYKIKKVRDVDIEIEKEEG